LREVYLFHRLLSYTGWINFGLALWITFELAKTPKYPLKKEAAGSPLNCRVKTGGNQSNFELNRFNQYFPWAWTLFPLEFKNRAIKYAIGALFRLILSALQMISLLIIALIYNRCIHFIMSLTSVYSIRIDTRVRKMIEEMPDQNWQAEIRTLIEQSVRKKRKEYLLSRARENQHMLITGMPAAHAIREDRDAR